MRIFFTAALLMACVLGMAPGVRGQQAEPPEAPRPQPIHMPPDFQGSPRQPQPRRPAFDAAKAQKRAQELAKLANQVPGEINQMSHDVFPKDLIQNLKRIEKLAKQLRGQVSR
jgi:hypothetical protein